MSPSDAVSSSEQDRDLRRRSAQAWALQSLRDFAAGGNYGGSWFDAVAGVLHVGFVGTPPAEACTRLAQAPAGVYVVVEAVQWPEAELLALHHQVWRQRSALEGAGVVLASGHPDVERNRVWLGVTGSAPAARAALEALFGADAEAFDVQGGVVSMDWAGDDTAPRKRTGVPHGGRLVLSERGPEVDALDA